ncbi:MAG: PepSY domain-containing protein [Lachnospiraceae bacterium]|nr:PepSY domain-containing protein [Lachnospiraceae bacterium]
MMKKYMAAGIVAISVLGAASGCGLTGGKDIGKDAALEAALQDAGVTEEEATRLKTSKDSDDGRAVYEIQFDANGTEYDYEIAAEDGTILNVDTESIASNTTAQNQDTQGNESGQVTQNGQQNNTQNTQAQSAGANVAVSQEQAMQTALERVPGATESDIRMELDNDDGQYKYEGNIIYDQREYEFEIDANTGTVLEWSEERR